MNILESAPQANDTGRSIAKLVAELNELMKENERHSLTGDEKRIMGYFWNDKFQRERKKIPIQTVFFFEIDGEHPGAEEYVLEQAQHGLASLIQKQFLRLLTDTAEIELDVDGMAWIKDEHPSAIKTWQKFLGSIPPTTQVISALVGFVASVFGVIEFVRTFL